MVVCGFVRKWTSHANRRTENSKGKILKRASEYRVFWCVSVHFTNYPTKSGRNSTFFSFSSTNSPQVDMKCDEI